MKHKKRKEKYEKRNVKTKQRNNISSLSSNNSSLIILAGISINLVLGENGILTKAQEAKTKTEQTTLNEQIALNEIVEYMNGEGENKPKLPSLPENTNMIESDMSKGIVIKDKNNNEWVWIEVPKTVYITATSKTDYAKIESDLKAYTSDYSKSGYGDTWMNNCAIPTETEYNNLKNKMLSSVYENEGFWIGRYETGTQEFRPADEAYKPVTPLIQKDKYPYNSIKITDAQNFATQVNPDTNYTTSLMFGIQWDLVCKYIEVKGAKTQSEIKIDSKDWGNYEDTTFDITEGKYSTDNGTTFNIVSGKYTKPINISVLLTTGISERNKVLNIYDFSGNRFEFILETNSNDISSPCVYRGGHYGSYGDSDPSSYRSLGTGTTTMYGHVAYRYTLYK